MLVSISLVCWSGGVCPGVPCGFWGRVGVDRVNGFWNYLHAVDIKGSGSGVCTNGSATCVWSRSCH
ncbi:hypothetical protein A2U01_0001421 [Trifolium medium]|uniref:Secreted protein n=1 Tax=Trifolium medium TaxID=97028 RepID=A0A392M043_9FABA|nr:hypothetical protein [Trifolium medium]